MDCLVIAGDDVDSIKYNNSVLKVTAQAWGSKSGHSSNMLVQIRLFTKIEFLMFCYEIKKLETSKLVEFLIFCYETEKLDTSKLIFSKIGGDSIPKYTRMHKNNICC